MSAGTALANSLDLGFLGDLPPATGALPNGDHAASVVGGGVAAAPDTGMASMPASDEDEVDQDDDEEDDPDPAQETGSSGKPAGDRNNRKRKRSKAKVPAGPQAHPRGPPGGKAGLGRGAVLSVLSCRRG
jgi:hypothetical protein